MADVPQRMPRYIRLMTQRIPVTEQANLHHESERINGLYDGDARTIVLDAGMGFEVQRETFLHESLHAMLVVGNLNRLLSGKMEPVVTTFAPILLSWLRDNPRAVAYLAEKQR